MKLKGTIRRSNLEGGQWVLQTVDGGESLPAHRLRSASPRTAFVAEVEGKVGKNAMGIGMMGPQLAVQKITARG